MKPWQTKNGRKVLAVAVVCAAFVLGCFVGMNAANRRTYAALWEAMATLPEPEECALCGDGMSYHAPCLVDLSTGKVEEMKVYTDHPTRPGQLAPMEMQETGTLCFFPCAGLQATRDTCAHTCEVTLPQERPLMNPAHFCGDCRRLLAEAGLEGYVVADLYDLDHIRAYPLPGRGGEIIRGYRISILNRQKGVQTLYVAGLLENETH